MNLALWIGTGLLAAVALAGGTIKVLVPQQKLAATPGGQWTEDVSAGVVKILGALELLAAVGLIVPAVVGIATVLVPVTALCWALLMIGAMITHGRRGEFRFAVLNLIYLMLAVFIMWGRFGPAAFTG
ncbi:DoxX family protein [Actinomadura bangladeshensis]|uniref:DoxX family protein n=1 Tax=Actinomadura bangladeshensis TaxID=453573 RepID=A0A6L9QEA8_9ACTN|nr:DoxX family protein [Actinomadura bangladeshensis]NEA23821.1 DoxX family protein [Actinomadura bangladeshensis]